MTKSTPPSAQEWDEVRAAFASSIMVDTSLSSLAQNLEGPDWPIKGPNETPAAYIDLGYSEACELLQMKGYPDKMGFLISLLKDTLSFDDPFGEMVSHTESSAERENPLLKNLNKLGIAESFPINLTGLDADTLDFCRTEKLTTLGEFGLFAQNMSRNIIVGGDFKKLLNALSHVDEKGLAEVLPFRPGSKGLHLFECLAQQSRSNQGADRTSAVLAYFADEFTALRQRMSAGGDLARELIVLNDAAAESRVSGILMPLVGVVKAATTKKGFFARLFGK